MKAVAGPARSVSPANVYEKPNCEKLTTKLSARSESSNVYSLSPISHSPAVSHAPIEVIVEQETAAEACVPVKKSPAANTAAVITVFINPPRTTRGHHATADYERTFAPARALPMPTMQ